jgi:pSer/pThr/pTyr-binding forkhead associated (FHA) protein
MQRARIFMAVTVTCGVCGMENAGDAQVCERCGVSLVKQGVLLVGDFELRVSSENRGSFQLNTPQEEGYIIGRTDEASDFKPDIDLASYGGREQGVSRRHAALVRYRGALHILDLNSVNGTFLNGKRLLADTPYPLSAGDSLKLGNMNLAVVPTKK